MSIKIGGAERFSLVDYPEKVAAVLFLQGCPWRCPFCYNTHLQAKYTGGTVLHLYMNQRVSSAQVCRDIVKRVLTNYRLPYITITPTFSVCPKHGYIAGEHKFCPLCDEEKRAAKLSAAAANSNTGAAE